MASVSVLYIADDTVGPHLELLRQVCEPGSTSRPHVSVRYFEKLRVPDEHLHTRVEHIDLVEPGSYGLERPRLAKNRTVYIRCQSDALVPLEHKPHYPASEFHITVYDGKSLKFARALLKMLGSLEWGFRVPLPEDTTLTRIKLRSGRSARAQPAREYSNALKELFHRATSEQLSLPYLERLPDERRLELAWAICDHLRQSTATYKRVPSKSGSGASSHDRTQVEEGDTPDIHLTPPELAREVASYAVGLLDAPGSNVHFGDPAVGNGAFYSALLQVLPQSQIASAIGIDISAQQVAAAQWRWAHKGMEVMRGDYLHMERLPARTLILANPPYLRHQGIPPKYKQELRERASVSMGMRVSARSGQYVYFLLLSHAWMAPGAVAAWLVPSEFMQTAYGAAVRHYLTHRVQLVRVHQFGHDEPQFENAKVLPAVVVFRNSLPSADQTAILSKGGRLANPIISETVRVGELSCDAKWWIPRHPQRTRRASDIQVGDLFVVRRGIATGANDFFVMERATAVRLGLPIAAVRPVLPKARTLQTDIVEREADGYPRVRPQLCLLDCDLPEGEIRTRYPRLMKYLLTAKDLDILKRNLVRQRHPWYKQERRDPPPFLCTYMGRGRANGPPLRFVWNKSDAVATNTYLMLYPRAALAKLLRERPDLTARLFILLQQTARETMSEIWRVHAGGLHKIEPGELLRVRLSSSPVWLLPGVDSHLPLDQTAFSKTRGRAAPRGPTRASA